MSDDNRRVAKTTAGIWMWLNVAPSKSCHPFFNDKNSPPAVIIEALVCWRFLAELLSNGRHTHRLCLRLCLSGCLDACRDCGRHPCQVLNSSTQRLHLSALVSPSLTHLLFSFTYSLTICDIRTPGSIYVWFYCCALFKRHQFVIVPSGFTVGGYIWLTREVFIKKSSQNQSYFCSLVWLEIKRTTPPMMQLDSTFDPPPTRVRIDSPARCWIFHMSFIF